MLEQNENFSFYPACKRAGMNIRTEGPCALKEGHAWLLDARDVQWPEGTLVHITMAPDMRNGTRKVTWENVPEDSGPSEFQTYQHTYFIVGSWTSHRMFDMTPVPGERGVHEYTFRIGPSGTEHFQIVRDGDPEQVFYPAYPRAQRSSVPVRGPDHLGARKFWVVSGEQGELTTVRIQVQNGHVLVEASTRSGGTRKWESVDGRNRKSFFVTGSWLPGFVPMEGDGFDVYKLQMTMTSRESEEFQIVMDEDTGRAYYPENGGYASGQLFVCGPDADGYGKNFRITGLEGMVFEIVLNLRAVDRRKIVTWRSVAEEGMAALPWSNASPAR